MILRSVIWGYASSSYSEKPVILKLLYFFGVVWRVWHLKLRLWRPMVINNEDG